VAHLVRLIAALLLLVFAVPSWASFAAPTYQYQASSAGAQGGLGVFTTGWVSAQQDAAVAWQALYNAAGPTAANTAHDCYYNGNATVLVCYYGSGTSNYGYISYATRTGQCPANSTGTTSCMCNTGYVQGAGAQAGTCVAPPASCNAGAVYSPQTSQVVGTGGANNRPSSLSQSLFQTLPSCDLNGCALTSGGQSARGELQGNTWSLILPQITYSGANCSPSSTDSSLNSAWQLNVGTANAAPAPCPAGTQSGTFNGGALCVPSQATTTGQSSSSSGTTVTTPAAGSGTGSDTAPPSPGCIGSTKECGTGSGSSTAAGGGTATGTGGGGGGGGGGAGGQGNGCTGVKCSNNSVTTCTNGTCTTQSTGTVTNTDGSTTQTNTSSTQSLSSYCSSSGQTDPQCAGSQGGFSGNCASGFVATGKDAVLDAMAKEQYTRNCQMFDTTGVATAAIATESALPINQGGSTMASSTVNLSGSIDESDALGGGGCSLDKTITVARMTVTLPFSNALCTPLAALGSLLVAVSLLAAAVIIGKG